MCNHYHSNNTWIFKWNIWLFKWVEWLMWVRSIFACEWWWSKSNCRRKRRKNMIKKNYLLGKEKSCCILYYSHQKLTRNHMEVYKPQQNTQERYSVYFLDIVFVWKLLFDERALKNSCDFLHLKRTQLNISAYSYERWNIIFEK